jgi:hypothetical protein
MRLLVSREAIVGSRLRRSGTMFVAQQKREALGRKKVDEAHNYDAH